jgi:ribosomal protein S8
MKASVNLINQLNFSLAKRTKFFVCENSKINILVLQLLLQYGLILGFHRLSYLKGKLCVFIKYIDKRPIIKKIELIKNMCFKNSIKIEGDISSNLFYVVSCNNGTLFLTSAVNFLNTFNWYNKLGGRVLFKIIV